ncbi:DNA internalization-related competence protein ComEC/Rec2 [Thalassotalea sp. 1_MG-2023]|uniref:DNA internalization-related competence protein ComEC/Rec2 n=1 Tax=Thalassotalea sp. 1_MG-2023 TaxID=3062680 RepID=UPI0026E468F4|nr:DNA internalization-related competence protein ComEC/Rec2 [Thalassotalea sp. 1_MG-2023]MDO6427889.1 DNA internalization-related competence protein ComEC/Rec2 [Thalassotalea sp. 1_MG-2023]
MDRWLSSFLIGALLSLFLPIVPSLFYALLFTLLSLIVGIFLTNKSLVWFCLGVAWILYHGAQYEDIWQNNNISTELLHKSSYTVIGEVLSIPQMKEKTQRFNFSITQFSGQVLNQPINVRLSWKSHKNALKQGQKWQLKIKIKPAYGLANEGGFHYQTWLRQHNIHATGYVIKGMSPIKSKASVRQHLYEHYQNLLPKHQNNALLLALTFGLKHQISEAQWQVLNATATQHLIAISGLHLGVVAMLSYGFSKLILRLLSLIALSSPRISKKLTVSSQVLFITLLTLVFVTFYAYIAGFSQPTIRAAIMLIILWCAKLLATKFTATRLILLTMFIIVIFSPFSLLSASFWLSISAVSTIFLFIWRYKKHVKSEHVSIFIRYFHVVLYALCFQGFLIFTLLPLTSSMQYQVSLVAILANIIAVPWVSVVCVPLTLLSVIASVINETSATVLISLAQLSLTVLWHWLDSVAKLSWASISIDHSTWLILAVMVFVSVVMLLITFRKRTFIYSVCGVSLTLVGLAYLHNKQSRDSIWLVDVLDVGQGLSVVIRANEQTVVYDTGATYPSGFSMAKSVVKPYLTYQGISDLDLLIISHDDNDHASGQAFLEAHFQVKELMFNQKNHHTPCLTGQIKKIGRLTFEVLHPTERQADHNDDSCVVRISDDKFSVLLTGDISKKVELALVDNYGEKLNSDVLVAPHHGSKTSSSKSFIQAVSPNEVIFSAGFLNRWNMPHQDVVNRYHQVNIKTYTTATDGRVRVIVGPEGYQMQTYRETHWPFWFAN